MLPQSRAHYDFLKQPRSRACVIIFSNCHDHGPVLSFAQAATITGLHYHFFSLFILPRSRASSIIFSSSHDHGSALSFFLYCHDHGPVLSFPQAATITGLRYHFFFYILPRSRARFPIFSCCLDHGPAYHFQAATITGLHYNVMYIYCLDHGKFRNRQ